MPYPLMPTQETYRIVDESVRPGNSPSDLLMVVRPVSESADTDVNVPFKAGTKLFYVPMKEVTLGSVDDSSTDANGVVQEKYKATIPFVSGVTKVLIFGKSMNQQF